MEREELGFPGCITIHMLAIPLTNAAVNVLKTPVVVYLQQTDSSCYDVTTEEEKHSVLGIFLVFNNHSLSGLKRRRFFCQKCGLDYNNREPLAVDN